MIINGNALADQVEQRTKQQAQKLIHSGVRPGLGIVLVGENPASVMYVGLKEKMAGELGYFFRKEVLPLSCSHEDMVAVLTSLNKDERIHGILVQLPLPPHLSVQEVGALIAPTKDVDCFHPENLAVLSHGAAHFPPPTAESVRLLIESTGKPLKGAYLVVVGAGFFGRQIAAHCASHGAVVMVANSRTPNLPTHIHEADILVVAIGKPRFITGDMVKAGAVVIDVGINRVDGDVVGDIDFDTVVRVASAITPVPGGVGPLTVALLMNNVLHAAQKSIAP